MSSASLGTECEPLLDRDVAKNMKGTTFVPEDAPTHDSQANGLIERAIQTVQGLIRAMKSALEENGESSLKLITLCGLGWWNTQHFSSLEGRWERMGKLRTNEAVAKMPRYRDSSSEKVCSGRGGEKGDPWVSSRACGKMVCSLA